MKFHYTFSLLLLLTTSMFGQFSENFDNSHTLPSGWAVFSGTNGLGTNSSWGISDTHYRSSNHAAHVHYENVSGGLAEDWLVTPQINLTGYSGCTLTFFGSISYPMFDDGNSYTIRVSTTSQTNIASFTTIATYNEGNFGYTQPISNQKAVDLSAYNGQQIYIAFVMTQDDGDNWTVDDINVSGTLSAEEFNVQNTITVFPNPIKDMVSVATQSEIETLQIVDLTGKIIKQTSNSASINTESLANGVYFLKVHTKNDETFIRKVVKN